MVFTEEILRQVIAAAKFRTAKSLGILTDDDPFLNDNVIDAISASTGHREALDEFVSAYEAWYGFHLKVYKEGKLGMLTPAEIEQLEILISRRDAARTSLLDITS